MYTSSASRNVVACCSADPEFLFRVRELSAAEDQLSPCTLALMRNALAAGPCLLLGFMCLEGEELVRQSSALMLPFMKSTMYPTPFGGSRCAHPANQIRLQ